MKKLILVVGESCVDTFIYGSCNRLCPEGPVPVFIEKYRTTNGGMAENVEMAIKALTSEYEVIGINQKTEITKSRYVDDVSGQLLLRVDIDNKIPENDTFNGVDSLENVAGVVISSYNKGFICEQKIWALSAKCHELGIPVFMDCKFVLGPWSQMVTFVKINNKEYLENKEKNCLIPERYCKNLIVTKGKQGSILKRVKEEDKIFPVPNVEVSSVTGCGDTHLSMLCVKYLETQDIEQSIVWANYAASLAATRRGTSIVSMEDVCEFKESNNRKSV